MAHKAMARVRLTELTAPALPGACMAGLVGDVLLPPPVAVGIPVGKGTEPVLVLPEPDEVVISCPWPLPEETEAEDETD